MRRRPSWRTETESPGLFEGLRTCQLLEGTGAVLEGLFGVIDSCGGNRLETLAHLTERPNGRIEAILGCPLELFTKLLNV